MHGQITLTQAEELIAVLRRHGPVNDLAVRQQRFCTVTKVFPRHDSRVLGTVFYQGIEVIEQRLDVGYRLNCVPCPDFARANHETGVAVELNAIRLIARAGDNEAAADDMGTETRLT